MIAGRGMARCVAAARPSEAPSVTVLLLEAVPSEIDDLAINPCTTTMMAAEKCADTVKQDSRAEAHAARA